MTDLVLIAPDESSGQRIAKRCNHADRRLLVTHEPPVGGEKLRCRVLMIPGGQSCVFADADCIVTYGMDARDTLTLSSIGDECCLLALQREVVTASGGILERQELKIRSTGCAFETIASSGAMLILGLVSPDG